MLSLISLKEAKTSLNVAVPYSWLCGCAQSGGCASSIEGECNVLTRRAEAEVRAFFLLKAHFWSLKQFQESPFQMMVKTSQQDCNQIVSITFSFLKWLLAHTEIQQGLCSIFSESTTSPHYHCLCSHLRPFFWGCAHETLTLTSKQDNQTWYHVPVCLCRKCFEPDLPGVFRLQRWRQPAHLLDEGREVHWGPGWREGPGKRNQVRSNFFSAKII